MIYDEVMDWNQKENKLYGDAIIISEDIITVKTG